MKTFFNHITLAGVALAATLACAKENYGDAPKPWDETGEYFASADEKGFSTYYTPSIGRVGDPMPFYDTKAGEFKVLYLQEFDNNATYNFHPIWGVSTQDGASYTSLGEVLPVGASIWEQDAAIGTGCCIYNEADQLYYMYYTGHNGNCTNREVVLRATSPDFKTWTKDYLWALKGDDFGFAKDDFRDPQIFKADDGKWHMVISSNLRFADFVSNDLKDWTLVGGFNMVWDRMCECPDVFKMGDWWYFIYSEGYRAPWSRKVKYMMADSWEGLKNCFGDPGAHWPQDMHEGVLDSRAFYAGKTASDGEDRYIWGWCPTRTGATIFDRNVNVGAASEPNWSGALVCHKILQKADGTLTLGEVPAIADKYNQAKTLKVMASNGFTPANGTDGKLSGDNAYVLYNRLGAHNHIAFTVTTSNKWDKFGISLVRGTDSKKYYTMVLNPEWDEAVARKVNFEEEGEEGKGFVEGIDGYIFARPEDNVYNIDIYTDNSVVVMYINDVCAYTQRIYGIQKNCWSINSYGGTIVISDLSVSQY